MNPGAADIVFEDGASSGDTARRTICTNAVIHPLLPASERSRDSDRHSEEVPGEPSSFLLFEFCAKPACPQSTGSIKVRYDAEHVWEEEVSLPARLKLEGSKCKGQLLIFGATNWDLIGRKEVPKQQGHNSDGKFIARAQRIEYDCELVPRRVAIFIEKTKDGQILPVPNVVVRDVACGANHTLVLDSQKRVFSWGFGGYGRLGHAEQKDEMVPRLVKLFDFPGRGAAQIYAGYTCSFAVSEVGDPRTRPRKSSIIVAADESTISWGPSPTFGELGYGDHKPKSSTAAQEVKTLDGIFTEQVAMGYAHSLVIARDESEAEKEKIKKLPEYNPRTL
ncbi:protein RCC2 [Puma concolor]|uniref:Protein RCC2 n=1 Tax=Puma concolor TaxID=9696 RepID=A0A6P6HZB0_PUMCO|nr:protein RCC2 [Puma concolor]